MKTHKKKHSERNESGKGKYKKKRGGRDAGRNVRHIQLTNTSSCCSQESRTIPDLDESVRVRRRSG